MIFSIVIAVIAVAALIIVLSFVSGKKSNDSGNAKKTKQKNRAQVIRNATKKLSQDPNNVPALLSLADLYYQEHLWEKALPLYESLVNLSTGKPEIDTAQVCFRHGLCAIKLGKPADALKSLIFSQKLNPGDYDANFYLGYAFYKSNEFEKAVPYFRKAVVLNPEGTDANAYLGLSLYKAKHFRESVNYLRRAFTDKPNDKEILFSMADAMQECGAGDKALKVFIHLRPDPVYGPRASLTAGIIHTRAGQLENAIQDFQIGLKLQDIPQDIMLELNYRLAQCYFSSNKIPLGLTCLNAIKAVAPNYKDVNVLLQRYKELNSNSNLNLYLTASASDFVALCRNIVNGFYKDSHVRIMDVAVQPECVEILCEIDTAKWEDTELFRFYRSTGVIGELFVRDFLAKIKDKKVDRGFCISPASFSEEAHKCIEGRPIDLVEKAEFMKILKTMSAR